VVPHLSFDELAARLQGDPDIVVTPQIADIRSSTNVPVVEWVKRQGGGHAPLFSWCTGAEVLAESGVIDGKTVTAHWGDIDRLERTYPKIHWQRGVRYVDGGMLLSTAGLTAGVDATLHLLARRHGAELAEKVAQGLNIPPSPFVANPKLKQYEFGPADGIFLLNAAFRWPKPRLGVWLYDGVGELDLASVADVYAASATHQIYILSAARSVVSRHGLQFIPRWQVQTLPALPMLQRWRILRAIRMLGPRRSLRSGSKSGPRYASRGIPGRCAWCWCLVPWLRNTGVPVLSESRDAEAKSERPRVGRTPVYWVPC
jgi:AraC family transcriptional regulator, transcriptional activator FtrA